MIPKNDIKFSAADFERYYAGQMNAQEMYALEKAALEDPFLQDALEGYQYTHSATEEVALLKSKIQLKKVEPKQQKPPFILFKNYNFLKAAVVLAFIVGTSYIIINQNSNSQKPSLAKQTETVSASKILDTTTLNKVTTDAIVAEEKVLEKEKAPVIVLNNRTESGAANRSLASATAKSKRSYKNEPQSLEDVAAAAPAPLAVQSKTAGNEKYLIKGKIVNEVGKPVPFAIIEGVEPKVNADISGNFSAYIKDSSLYGNVVASGYLPLQKKFKNNQFETIVLNTATPAKNNDMVLAETYKKLPQPVSARAAGSKISSKEAPVTLLQPLQGWAFYEKYLKDSVRYINPTPAKVELHFYVNTKGEPQNIVVKDGLCVPCNTEAIRLLKQGPLWQTNTKQKGILKVQF